MAKMVGFNLKKISIERKEDLKEKLEVKSNVDITDIKEEKIELSKDKDVLSFNFNFDVNYEPKIAELNFKGNVLVLVEPNEAKEILKKWKKKQIADDLRILVLNTILNKCNVMALNLEDDLNLPSHIPLPKLSLNANKQQGYTG